MKYVYSILFFSIFTNCRTSDDKLPITAEQVIEESINASGSALLDRSEISFNFRNMTYRAVRNDGLYQLSRLQISGTDTIYDQFDNDVFQRKINGKRVKVADSMAENYKSSVNSVHYFSVLPYGLDAEAVRLKYLDSVKIKGKDYHKIQVKFAEEGGGEDFQDVFIYWIHKDSNYVDYLAYSYHTNGGGMRFREAYNDRVIAGIRFVDYNNYMPKVESIKLEDLDEAYVQGRLDLLSKIELKSITIN